MSKRISNWEDLPEVLGVEDLQGALGISRATAYSLVHQHGFPSFVIGRSIKTLKSNLIDWLSKQKVKA